MISAWWHYLSIPKLQRLHRWNLGMDKYFHPTLYWAGDYLSMLGFKFIHISERGPVEFSWSKGSMFYIIEARYELGRYGFC